MITLTGKVRVAYAGQTQSQRIIMFKITFGDQTIPCAPGQTALDALLDHHIELPYSCRQGACQSCLSRCLNTDPPAASQQGLRAVQVKQRYFLPCVCLPETDMAISNHLEASRFRAATVSKKRQLSHDTIELTLATEAPCDYFAGQFVNLRRPDGLTRSYSIANSQSQGNYLTFHIRKLPSGQFSEWAHHTLAEGDRLEVSEPLGICFYLPERQEQSLLLIATGSGLAPLVGIIQEALEQGHQGDIHLFHGSRTQEGLYLVEEMRALSQRHANLHYTPCISASNCPEGFAAGRANEVALARFPSLKHWRIYLCGHPEMVNQTKIQAFLKGASSQDIYADAFYLSPRDAQKPTG